jgi:hypothetical protein
MGVRFASEVFVVCNSLTQRPILVVTCAIFGRGRIGLPRQARELRAALPRHLNDGKTHTTASKRTVGDSLRGNLGQLYEENTQYVMEHSREKSHQMPRNDTKWIKVDWVRFIAIEI